jgi:hypothetical protein
MFKDVFTVINEMQADGIIERYALGGAVAATFYLEPISTIDVDFFVSFPAVSVSLLCSTKPIFDYLTERGNTIEGEYLVIAGWPTGRPKDHARLVQFVDSGILDTERLDDILSRHGLLEKWRQFRDRFFGGLR